jgi:8-hydroxy-5-deazaflavin:NADPH oxidoreductase
VTPLDPVPVIGGTGALGFGLALRLASAGVPVVVGSRDAARAAAAASEIHDRTGCPVEGMVNADALRRGPIVVLSIPFASQIATLKGLRDAWAPGQILFDATVPLATAIGGRATQILRVPQGSAAQQAAAELPPGIELVSGLHTISARVLADLAARLDEDVLIAGDSADAKRRVASLLATVGGLRAVDAGRLEAAALIESLTPLLIGINARYKTHAGIRITGVAC